MNEFKVIEHNFETIQVSKNELGIGLLEINRPDKLNALNAQVLTELKEFLSSQLSGKSFKGLILTGSGEKAFIAGADIKSMSSMSIEDGKVFGKLGQDVTFLFESLPYPVIAAVNGFALGGGCEMAMSCDFIYATQNAVFGQPEVKLGLIPGYGGTQRLAKIIGRNRASELIYTGRNIAIDEAVTLGLVLKVCETKSQLIEEALQTFKTILKNSPAAINQAKKVMKQGNDLPLEQGLQLELDSFSNIFTSPEFMEGTSAFIEKRKANFN